MLPDTLGAFLSASNGELIDRERRVPFAALADESARLASAFESLGVGPGDRVAVWLPNVPAWLAVFFACARLGAIAVSVNTRFRSHELADIVGRTRAKLLCFWPEYRQIDFEGILAGCDPAALSSLQAVVCYDERDEGAGLDPSARVAGRHAHRYRDLVRAAPLREDRAGPDTGVVMFTTSGTTRAPKFVLHAHRGLIRHARDVAAGFGYLARPARLLVTAPLCGVFGFCNALSAIAAQCPLVMSPGFDAREAADAVVRHRITHTHATDEMIAQMLAATDVPRPFPSVEWFGYAAFSPGLVDLPLRAAQRGLVLAGLYGMSEVQALAAVQPADAPLPQRALAGGRLVAPEGRVRACDPESGEVLAHGVAGELQLRVPSVMSGYFENDAANREAFTADGWFRTGDLGHTVSDTAFVFVTRLGDALRLSGFMVSPAEIEEVLQQHPSIESAQVVGALAADGMTKPVAFVIPRDGARVDEGEVRAHCAARLARFKVPVRVVDVDAFPVTPGANATKIQKTALRERAAALLAGRGETETG